MSRKDEFVIWMSSTAMNAPSMVPNTATHFRKSIVRFSSGITQLSKVRGVVATALWAVLPGLKACSREIDRPQAGGYSICKILHRSPHSRLPERKSILGSHDKPGTTRL